MNRYLHLIMIMVIALNACHNNTKDNSSIKSNINEESDLASNLSETASNTLATCANLNIIAKTVDKLYIESDSSFYLMLKSPLDQFDNYKNLYDDFPKVQMVEYTVSAGEVLPLDNRYYCWWSLKNNMLYLGDILFFSLDNGNINYVFPNNKHYRLMEKLTDVAFDKSLPALPNFYNRSSTFKNEGMMPALWFSDTLFVKERRKYDEDYELWKEKPCKQLIFKRGKLQETIIYVDPYPSRN